MTQLILASRSPRRTELRTLMGYQCQVQAADIDESVLENESPTEHVMRLANQKASAVVNRLAPAFSNDSVVLASDTIVVIEQRILGKPTDFDDFVRMMRLLSGSNHYVHTAIAAVHQDTTQALLVSTEVSFCELTDQEILTYWQSGEPQDKAGGYGIQAIGGQFVSAINGSYSAVVGLPMAETKQLLAKFGVRP